MKATSCHQEKMKLEKGLRKKKSKEEKRWNARFAKIQESPASISAMSMT